MAIFSTPKSDLPMPLTSIERAELAECETQVTNGIKAFTQAGKALARIRSGQLYRESHNDFSAYVADRWKMTRQHADRLIAAAEVVSNLTPIGAKALPLSEYQARQLAPLDPKAQAEAWDEVISKSETDDAGNPVVSTDAIKAAVAKRRPKKSKKAKAPKPVRILVPGATVIVAGNAKFSGDVVAALQAAIAKLASTEQRRAAA